MRFTTREEVEREKRNVLKRILALISCSMALMLILVASANAQLPIPARASVTTPKSPFWNNPGLVMAVSVIIIGIVAVFAWRRGGFELTRK